MGTAQKPPYQAAQIVLLRLDRERSGPRQRPASEVDAAAQVQVLGPADGGRRGQRTGIHDFRHGSKRSAVRRHELKTLSGRTTTESQSWREVRRRGTRRARWEMESLQVGGAREAAGRNYRSRDAARVGLR